MTCWLTPQCVLQPETALDVSNAILISSFLGSQFAVRSGGHNPNVGFSSIGNEGILIDLARLNDVSMSSNGTLAAIGPGNRWGRVYEKLSAHGKMAVGGRANDIGVGGLLLGGGLSYWSSIHGMAANKVVNYEVRRCTPAVWHHLVTCLTVHAGRSRKFFDRECEQHT